MKAWGFALSMLLVGCSGADAPREPPLTADPPLSSGPSGPELGEARTGISRGIALVKAEKFADGKALLEPAMKVGPTSEGAFYLGVAQEKTGDRAGAEASYKQSLSLDAGAVEAAVNLAAIYLDDPPRPDEAVALLKSALAKSPGDPQLLTNLGYALGLKGDVDGASKAFDQALTKKPDADIELLYGTMLFENKQRDRAADHLKRALTGSKKDAATLATVGRMLGGVHLFAECVKAFDQAIAIKGDAAEFWVRRGTCRHELKDEPGAQADFEKAIQIDAGFAAAHYYLGVSLLAQAKPMPGTRELRKAIDLGKGTPIEKLAQDRLKEAFKGH